MDIVVWLRSLGLGKYEAAFRENEIDETVLLGLTAEDLKELGVGPVGSIAGYQPLIEKLSKPRVTHVTALRIHSTLIIN